MVIAFVSEEPVIEKLGGDILDIAFQFDLILFALRNLNLLSGTLPESYVPLIWFAFNDRFPDLALSLDERLDNIGG